MNIYTLYSQSHKILFDRYFVPTLPSEFTLKSYETEQLCSSGRYYESGWSEMCKLKVLLFRDACIENMGGLYVWSDVDIQFFGNCLDVMLEELGDLDIACQHDFTAHCSGLFIVRANHKTLDMFNAMVENYRIEDQTTLNDHINSVRNKYLSNKFFNYGQTRGHVWDGNEQFNVDKDILVHHANWTIGVDNKIRMLEYVRSKMAGRIISHI